MHLDLLILVTIQAELKQWPATECCPYLRLVL